MPQPPRALRWLICSLALFSVTAAASDAPKFEVTPFVGYRTGGEFEVGDSGDTDGDAQSVDIDDASSFGVDIGLYRDSSSFYELLYSRQEAGVDSSDPALHGLDVTTEYLHFGGTLLFDEAETWYLPYLSFTLGATRLEPQGGDYDSETKFSASLGGGFRLPFNDRVAATAGVRGYLTFVGSDTGFACVSVDGELTCLLKSSGSTYFQAEAQLGLSIRY
jgi:hypothetical protein